MRKYLYIGAGGFFGAICRFLIKSSFWNAPSGFPFATLLINVSGSFVLGLFLTLTFEAWDLDTHLQLGIATGFLGAFTTFSTLCKETIILSESAQNYNFIIYPMVSILLGLLCAYMGVVLARVLIPFNMKQALDE